MAQSASTTFKARMQAALFRARKARSKKWFEGLPTSDPHVDGRMWNDNGTVKESQG